MNKQEFEEYLKRADLHSIKDYYCEKCGQWQGSSRSNMETTHGATFGQKYCGGKVSGRFEKTYAQVYLSEYERFKAAGLIDW